MNTFYKLMIVLSLFSGKAAVCAAAAMPDIFEAVKQGNIDAVRQYIDAGGNVNVEDNEPGEDMTLGTPLRYALDSIGINNSDSNPDINPDISENIYKLLVANGANTKTANGSWISTSNGVSLVQALILRNKSYLIPGK